jgi:hypothetical protein
MINVAKASVNLTKRKAFSGGYTTYINLRDENDNRIRSRKPYTTYTSPYLVPNMISSTNFKASVAMTHIGTATAIIEIDGVRFITDPMFLPAGQ